jgi:hypothetical protein
VLLAPTFVLAIYAGQDASPYDLYRPLAAFTIAAAIAFGLIGGATRRWHAASFLVAMGVLAVVAVQFCLLAVAWLFMAWRATKRDESWGVTPLLTRPLNAFATAWFAVSLAAAVAVSVPAEAPQSEPLSVAPGPNVYLIWLDGYPRHDTLMEYFGFDNHPFLDALGERGFVVAEQSSSDYPSTIQTLATMMQMRPLGELIGDEWNGSHDQHRRLWQLINDARVPEAYEAAGYETYSIVSPAPGHDWRTADVVMDSPWLSDFEAHLFSNGILRPVLPFWAMHRADILDSFDYLEAAAGASPRFVLAHILTPHSPYVFAADGRPAEPCGIECANHAGPPNAMLGDRLIGQIQWVNGRALEAIDHVIAVDPRGIIVVFSDHGLRRDRLDMDEWFRTLFAARGSSFPDDVTTSDVLPSLMSQTLGSGPADTVGP